MPTRPRAPNDAPRGNAITTTAKRALQELGAELARAPTEATLVKMSAKPSSSGGLSRNDVVVVVLDEAGATVQRLAGAHGPTTPAADDVRLFFQTLEVMRSQKRAPELPAHEAALLDEAGFRDDPLTATLVMEQSKKALDELLSFERGGGSMSLDRTAKLLDVTPSRLRQRLGAERTLYGIKQGRTWHIPVFQLDRRRAALVRNVEQVIHALPMDAHPLAVHAFFVNENPDLVIETSDSDEQPVSPIAWLKAGNDPSVVIALAMEL